MQRSTVTLLYEGQSVKMARIAGKPWWALRDMCRIFDFGNISHFANRLDKEDCKIFSVDLGDKLGARKAYFVNKNGLDKALTLAVDEDKAAHFKTWIENEILPNFDKLITFEAVKAVKNNFSIQASFQKAQMLIRIAENKAVPHSEQLRLLDMAVQELTGAGFKAEEIPNVKQQSVERAIHDDIMDLPEVVGFIHEKETKNVNGCLIDFLPADMMASRWSSHCEHSTFSGKDFSELAEESGYKTAKYGFWQRVMTPQGEAREFMYIDGTMLDYLYRKYQRVA